MNIDQIKKSKIKYPKKLSDCNKKPKLLSISNDTNQRLISKVSNKGNFKLKSCCLKYIAEFTKGTSFFSCSEKNQELAISRQGGRRKLWEKSFSLLTKNFFLRSCPWPLEDDAEETCGVVQV